MQTPAPRPRSWRCTARRGHVSRPGTWRGSSSWRPSCDHFPSIPTCSMPPSSGISRRYRTRPWSSSCPGIRNFRLRRCCARRGCANSAAGRIGARCWPITAANKTWWSAVFWPRPKPLRDTRMRPWPRPRVCGGSVMPSQPVATRPSNCSRITGHSRRIWSGNGCCSCWARATCGSRTI
ncbi:MAG: hypothetical protein ACYC18_08700 [Gammaproteobacteria bacterium]